MSSTSPPPGVVDRDSMQDDDYPEDQTLLLTPRATEAPVMPFGFARPPFANLNSSASANPATPISAISHTETHLGAADIEAEGMGELDSLTMAMPDSPVSATSDDNSPMSSTSTRAHMSDGHTAASSDMFYSAYSSAQQRPDPQHSLTAAAAASMLAPQQQWPPANISHSKTAAMEYLAAPAIVPMEMSQMTASVDLSADKQPRLTTPPPPQVKRWAPSSIYSEPSKQLNTPNQFTNKQSLYQDLLPPESDGEELEQNIDTIKGLQSPDVTERRRYRDVFFGTLYTTAVVTMFIVGIIYAATAEPLSSEFKSSLFYAFDRTRGYFSFMIAVSAVVGIAWLWALKKFIRAVLWITVALIPIGFFAVGVWSMNSAFISDAANPSLEPRWLIPESLLSFLFSFLSALLIRRKREQIVRGISLVELAFEVLRDNPTVFVVSFMLLAGYIIFSICWFLLFSRILLIGHIESSAESVTSRRWIPDPSSKWIVSYFVVIYLWTSAVFAYIDRCAISGVVCEWYFHRHDPLRNAVKRDLAWESFRRAITYSFGSICLAALIITVCSVIRHVTKQAKRIIRFVASENIAVRLISACIGTIESAVEGMNSYALVYVAYSGDNFCRSASRCTSLLRRNLLSALLMDNATKWVLMLGVYAMSSLSFVATYNFSAHVTQTPYAMAVSAFGCLVPFLMLRFCTFVLVQVMDVLYVCYVIDLDTGKCHSVTTHAIFGGDETQPVVEMQP